jgi:hypothetical protein
MHPTIILQNISLEQIQAAGWRRDALRFARFLFCSEANSLDSFAI